MARLLYVAIVLSIPPALAAPDVTSDRLGFGYCPPPVVPRCIDAAPSPAGSPALEACSRDVLRFTQTLGAYRACLTRESERAIGSGNAAIARFRCLAGGGTGCRPAGFAPATEQ